MTDTASRYAQVLADLAQAGVQITVTESRNEQLFTVRTAHGVDVFTVSRHVALEVGLLKRPLAKQKV